MRRLLIIGLFAIALLTTGLLATTPESASAGAAGNANTGSDGIDHGVRNTANTPGTGGRGGTPVCTYRPIDIAPGGTVYDDHGSPISTDVEGRWYEKWCGDADFAGVFYITPRQPADLAEEARRYLLLPEPAPVLSPAGDQIVNLPTWLWIEPAGWAEQQSTVSIPGVSVTVTARPEATIWNLGDGTVVTCDGPGTPYPSTPYASTPSDPMRHNVAKTPTCSHTFLRSSAGSDDGSLQASVTVRWRASWTVAGAAGGGDLGVIERTTAFAIRVGEVQAINTRAG